MLIFSDIFSEIIKIFVERMKFVWEISWILVCDMELDCVAALSRAHGLILSFTVPRACFYSRFWEISSVLVLVL